MTDWANRALNALIAIAFVAAAIAYGSASPAQAEPAAADDLSTALENRPAHVATNWNGVAANGYDVVALIIQGDLVKGDRDFETIHDGATYRFTNEANRSLFLKDPDALAPQYGGYGAMGIRVGKKIRPERTPAWQVADEKLFFFVDDSTKEMWNEDADANQRVAEAIWGKIRNVPIAILMAPATH